MWIASKIGFFSIVKAEPGHYQVRARCLRDLENLQDHLKVHKSRIHLTILKTPHADYAYRAIVTPNAMSAIYAALACTVTYRNFKDAVGDRSDQRNKLTAYHRLWSDLFALQESMKAGRYRPTRSGLEFSWEPFQRTIDREETAP